MQPLKSNLGVIILSALTGGVVVRVPGVLVGRSLIKREVADQMQKREERFITLFAEGIRSEKRPADAGKASVIDRRTD